MDRKIIYYSTSVFIISFIIHFSLTYNIDFFAEDNLFFGGDLNNPHNLTFKELRNNFLNGLLTTDQFFQVNYGIRPFHNIFTSVLSYLFGINIIIMRLTKVIMFSIIPLILFLFCIKTSKNYLTSFLVSVYFILLPENLFLNFYLIESLPYSTLFLVLSIFIFFFYYYEKSYSKLLMCFNGFLIILFTRISILIKHQGRIAFLLFGIFLAYLYPKKLIKTKYWLLILLLLIISYPILGIFNNTTSTDVSQHTGITTFNDASNAMITFVKTLPITFYPHGVFLAILFVVILFLNIVFIYLKASVVEDNHVLKESIIFSLIWFVLGAITLFIGRTLVFEPGNYMMRYYYSYLLFPQTLLLFAYPHHFLSKYKFRIIHYIIIFFLILAIFHNGYRLNSARGGWGDWILGWQTVRDYVESNNQTDVLIVLSPPPFYFRSKDKIIISEYTLDKTKLFNISKSFKNIYVVLDRAELEYKPDYLYLNTILKVSDSSIYNTFKTYLFRRESQTRFHIYQFNSS